MNMLDYALELTCSLILITQYVLVPMQAISEDYERCRIYGHQFRMFVS